MAINLAKNYTDLLDEVYVNASVSAILNSGAEMSRAGVNANEIVYPQISTTGLGDYSRTAGYTDAAVSLEWKTATFNYDRGAKITVDAMDNEESKIGAFALAGSTLMRTKVAPEADAFTFATLAGKAGTTATETLSTAQNFLDALLAAKDVMDAAEVPAEERYLFATTSLVNSLMSLETYKSQQIIATFAAVVPVVQSRFYTAIDLLDGKSSGETAGHYVKHVVDPSKSGDVAGANLNYMICHKPAVLKFDKHVVGDVIPAAANPNADADILKYRKYGLVDVFNNKTKGIYVSHA